MRKLREDSNSMIKKLLFIFAILWLLFLSVKQSSCNIKDLGSTLFICPDLTTLPNRLCPIWFTTQDKKLRKFNLPDCTDTAFIFKSQRLQVIQSC